MVCPIYLMNTCVPIYLLSVLCKPICRHACITDHSYPYKFLWILSTSTAMFPITKLFTASQSIGFLNIRDIAQAAERVALALQLVCFCCHRRRCIGGDMGQTATWWRYIQCSKWVQVIVAENSQCCRSWKIVYLNFVPWFGLGSLKTCESKA